MTRTLVIQNCIILSFIAGLLLCGKRNIEPGLELWALRVNTHVRNDRLGTYDMKRYRSNPERFLLNLKDHARWNLKEVQHAIDDGMISPSEQGLVDEIGALAFTMNRVIQENKK